MNLDGILTGSGLLISRLRPFVRFASLVVNAATVATLPPNQRRLLAAELDDQSLEEFI